MSAVLELRGMTVGRQGASIVEGLDLAVEPGEVVALLGANGAGKTTTLLTVSGFLAPLSGEMILFGERERAAGRPGAIVSARARRGLAHVPDDRALFAGLTGREHLRLAVPRGDAAAAVGRALTLFPALDPVLDRRVGVLSGGEQQMLAVARALVARPRLLLVDELSLGLAPKVVADLLAALRRVADDDGVAIVVVEQHVPLVLAVADRGVVLAGGGVALAASASELSADPDALADAYLGHLVDRTEGGLP